MRKADVKKVENHDLIKWYVLTYSGLVLSYNLQRETKRQERLCRAMEDELQERGLLTAQDVETLRL